MLAWTRPSGELPTLLLQISGGGFQVQPMAKLSLRHIYLYRFLLPGNDIVGPQGQTSFHCIRVMTGGSLSLEDMIIPVMFLEPAAVLVTGAVFADDHDDHRLESACCSSIVFVASGCYQGCAPAQRNYVFDDCGDYTPNANPTGIGPASGCECDPTC